MVFSALRSTANVYLKATRHSRIRMQPAAKEERGESVLKAFVDRTPKTFPERRQERKPSRQPAEVVTELFPCETAPGKKDGAPQVRSNPSSSQDWARPLRKHRAYRGAE